MKTTKSDWAATTPWLGITGKPTTFPTDNPDISQVGGRNFSDGQVPTWSTGLSRFVPRTPSSGGTTPVTPVVTPWYAINFYWDAPEILPLQSCYEDFYFIGAIPGDPVAIGPPFDLPFCQVTGAIVDVNLLRVTIFNGNLIPVDLSDGVWRAARFPNV